MKTKQNLKEPKDKQHQWCGTELHANSQVQKASAIIILIKVCYVSFIFFSKSHSTIMRYEWVHISHFITISRAYPNIGLIAEDSTLLLALPANIAYIPTFFSRDSNNTDEFSEHTMAKNQITSYTQC